MGKRLTRLREIAAKIESVEGTAETLAAADSTFNVYDPKFNPNVPYYQRNPARSSFTKYPGVPGPKAGAITFGVEMKGSGTASTAPGFSKLLKACGFAEVDPWKLTIGTITSGPFQAGERVTQATSGAIGIVMFETADGTTTLWLLPVSGTFDNVNDLTGGTSGASATPSAASQGVAIAWRPDSDRDTVPSLTIGGYFDGKRHVIRGARGTVTFAGTRGEIVMMQFEFTGVYDATTDVSLISPSPDSPIPPSFLDVSLVLQGGYSAVFQALSIAMNSEVSERENANNADGIESFLLAGRNPQMTIDPEQALVATHDFYGILRAGTTGRMEFQYGSTSGNRFRFGAPSTQYTGLSDDDRGGKAVAGVTVDLVGIDDAGEDELVILQD